MGASIVKWTTPCLYLVLSKSDSKLYTKSEMYEEKKIIDSLKTYQSTKPSNRWWQKQFQEKST